MTGRRALAWGFAGVALLALLATGVALVRAPLPPSPRGPEPGRALFQAHCASCHGAAGRGDSWRARLLFLRPGDLASPAMASLPDQYLADLIRHGGSTFGKPGMPSFGFVLEGRGDRGRHPVHENPAASAPGPGATGDASGGGRAGPDERVERRLGRGRAGTRS